MSNFYKDTGLNEARKIFGINMSDLLDLLESTDSDIEVYPKIFEELKKLELDKNLSKLKAVLNILGIKTDEMSKEFESAIYQERKSIILAKYDKLSSIKERITPVIKIGELNTVLYKYLFETVFDKKERTSFNNLSYMIENNYITMPIALNYIKEEDREEFINTYYKEAYMQARNILRPKELNTVLNKLKQTNEITITKDTNKYSDSVKIYMTLSKSNIIERLKEVYGKSYTEKTHKSLDDEDEFLATILTAKTIEQIYSKSMFDASDAEYLKYLINYLEALGKDVTNLRNKEKEIKQRISLEEKDLFNFIVANKNNTEILNNKLKSIGINKENYNKYISTRKFLDKKMKKSLIEILHNHYKKEVFTVSDIINIIQEAKDNNMTQSEILNMKGIDEKSFIKAYRKLKDERPEIYELIKTSRRLIDTKKQLELYNQIMNDNIKDVDLFIKTYGYTPEEILNMFEDTKLFKPLYDKTLTWYDMYSLLPKEDKNKKR